MANDIVIDNAVYNQWSQKDVSCIVCFGRSISYVLFEKKLLSVLQKQHIGGTFSS